MKPWLLHISTAQKVNYVAISRGEEEVLTQRLGTLNAAAYLHVAIQQGCKIVGASLKDFAAFCIHAGPGSFTGLRVGVSAAKALAFALKRPLIATTTFEIFLRFAKRYCTSQTTIVVFQHSYRDVYLMAAYDTQGTTVLAPQVIRLSQQPSFPIKDKCLLVGQVPPIWHNKGSLMPIEDLPISDWLQLDWERFQKKEFVNLITFEPFYLQPFIPKLRK